MTARELSNRMKQRADVVEREFRSSSHGLAVSAVKFTKEKMTQEIYAIPEDRTKKGRKKWRRTGHLRRSERAEVPNAYTVRVVNDAVYAEPRHEAGKPGHRNINPQRVSHWRDDLKETFAPIVLDVRRQTVLAILKRGQI